LSEKSEIKLIFIYNANAGGFFTGLKDTLHKSLRKSTYQCNLCAVTFGAFGMKKEWKNYVNNLDAPVEFFKKDKFKFEFLHKDEFEDKYELENAKFPSAYILKNNKLELFISRDEMNAVKTIEELKKIVDERLSKYT
jgi:hypothetical protein